MLSREMPSPNSSVGSKSSNGWKDIQFKRYHDDESIAEVLRTSWIRRLNVRTTSAIEANKDNPSPILTPAALNSPSSTGSGATVLCHRTTISTDESRTQTSIFNPRTTPFLDRLLKHHKKDKPSLKTDPEDCSFPGFGPFQIKNKRSVTDSDKVTGLGDDDDRLMNDCLEIQGRNENCDIKDLGHDVRWNLNQSRKSSENVSSRIVEVKEEQKWEDDSLLQQNWLSTNNRKISYFPEKRVADDEQKIPISPFFRNSSALKKQKHECLRENMPDRIRIKNECSFGPSVEEKNKFINYNFSAHNMNNPKCSSSSRSLVAGDWSRCEQRLSVVQWPMYRVSHDISYLSRNGGMYYHESSDDGGDGRINRDPHLTCHNDVLRQHERHAPANPDETEEPSSFWNMNRYQRAEMVSSIFQACRTNTKKRNSDPDEFVSLKSRKLDTEG